MNTCALCDKQIRKGGLCSKCYREWAVDNVLPDWLKALIKQHRVFEYSELKTKREIPFSHFPPGYIDSIPSK